MSAASDFLLLEECAEIARTSIGTIRFWCDTGKLASYKPGRRRLVKRSDLIELIERSATPAVAR